VSLCVFEKNKCSKKFFKEIRKIEYGTSANTGDEIAIYLVPRGPFFKAPSLERNSKNFSGRKPSSGHGPVLTDTFFSSRDGSE
jgi:hypothetical protein